MDRRPRGWRGEKEIEEGAENGWYEFGSPTLALAVGAFNIDQTGLLRLYVVIKWPDSSSSFKFAV